MQQPPIMPIDLTAVVAVFMGTLIVLIPVAGVTIRFAIKPIAEAMARMKESQGAAEQMKLMQQRMELMEHQLGAMESEMHRVKEVTEFTAQLKAPKT
jgi:uncharacterized protein YybS (DUF2232 family)